jgi:UPF0271 protein
MSHTIDLNADLGEGFAFDQPLLELVSSANISCGAHAGSPQDIQQAIRRAIENGVIIGAHPSYPDHEHWGRRSLSLSATQLRATMMSQLQWLETQVRELGGQLQHIKPHGALYNDAARDAQLAGRIAACVKSFDPSLILVGLAGGHLLDAGERAGLSVAAEAFVDRRYQADGSLVPRSHPQALITNVEEALSQAVALASHLPIKTIDGNLISIKADTLCIHGDSAHAVQFARAVKAALLAQGIAIRSLTRHQLA